MKNIFKILLLIILNPLSSLADMPITTDSRIRTYVYSPNEVYNLLILYGYQSSIEFANNEEVKTISLGDSFAWRVSPVSNRIFIRPLEEGVHTNLTVLTNKRSYQFDLFSKKITKELEKDLVYVMRFFYPSELDNKK